MKGKVIIVSGCSRGIGQAIVERLLQEGAIVACFSRSNPEWLGKYSGEQVYWNSVDLKDPEELKKFVNSVYKKYKHIDGLVNNAGVNYDGILTTMSEEKIHEILNLNIESTLLLTKQVVKFMMIKQKGSIVNISSIVGGYRGYKGASVYGTSKAALIGFTKSLARELGEKNVRVNAVLPGFVETNMTSAMEEGKKNQVLRRTPLKRFAQPSEIASVVKFLLSDEASYVTGHGLIADGGNSC